MGLGQSANIIATSGMFQTCQLGGYSKHWETIWSWQHCNRSHCVCTHCEQWLPYTRLMPLFFWWQPYYRAGLQKSPPSLTAHWEGLLQQTDHRTTEQSKNVEQLAVLSVFIVSTVWNLLSCHLRRRCQKANSRHPKCALLSVQMKWKKMKLPMQEVSSQVLCWCAPGWVSERWWFLHIPVMSVWVRDG